MDIFSAVKHGDRTRVMYLVEERGAPLQQRDIWDATPLYYASFTGNLHMIEYLLGKGARCEEKTFDGERCLYAALNDSVRSMLLNKGFKRAGARRHDLYLEFLEKLFDNPEAFCDIEFAFGAERILAHRFMLASRCPMLGRLNPTSLKALLKWCYTCRLELPVSASKACQQLLRALRLQALAEELAEDETDLTGKLHWISWKEANKMQGGVGEEGTMIVLEPEREAAKQQLQDAMQQCTYECSEALPSHLRPDVIFEVGSSSFAAHRATLCGRSEYFSVMFTSQNFREGCDANREESGHAQSICLEDVDTDVLQTSLQWVYSDRVNANLTAEHLLQVMRFADRLICEGLKQKCAVLLQPHVSPSSALFLLGEAMRLRAERLADACLRVVAQEIEQVVQEPLFAELIRESAASVENRQDVDSVPIVDDLRYHMTQLYGDGELSDDDSDWNEEGDLVCSGLEQDFELLSERKQKLFVLQELLANLGIEA